jgi:hypothetical protein
MPRDRFRRLYKRLKRRPVHKHYLVAPRKSSVRQWGHRRPTVRRSRLTKNRYIRRKVRLPGHLRAKSRRQIRKNARKQRRLIRRMFLRRANKSNSSASHLKNWLFPYAHLTEFKETALYRVHSPEAASLKNRLLALYPAQNLSRQSQRNPQAQQLIRSHNRFSFRSSHTRKLRQYITHMLQVPVPRERYQVKSRR